MRSTKMQYRYDNRYYYLIPDNSILRMCNHSDMYSRFSLILMGCHRRVGRDSAIYQMSRHALFEPKLFGLVFAFCLEYKYFDEKWQMFTDDDIERQLEQEGMKKRITSHNKIPNALPSPETFPHRLIPYLTPATIQCEIEDQYWSTKQDGETLLVYVIEGLDPVFALTHLVRKKQLPSWILIIPWRKMQYDGAGLFIPRQFAKGVHILIISNSRYNRFDEHDHVFIAGFRCALYNHCDIGNVEHIVFYDMTVTKPEKYGKFIQNAFLPYVYLFKTIRWIYSSLFYNKFNGEFRVLCDFDMLPRYLHQTFKLLDKAYHIGKRPIHSDEYNCELFHHEVARKTQFEDTNEEYWRDLIALKNLFSQKIKNTCP